ncbi:alginate export family protein [Sinomicrobium soli]|uniref:alginate export family protein n=1 Tax=Sinomicrobium sp. N-1-3-6 TaxID=2219864 RepID=UPI0011BE47A2|nr:alginate export family protein [Sinomicrobium sp. N-1-3-6]
MSSIANLGLVMRLKNCMILLIAFHCSMYGQEFALLRQQDNLRSIDSIEDKTLYQNLKIVDISHHTTLSFGGSWRFQTESFINGEFDRYASQDNSWYLNRFLAHAHLKAGRNFELFTELGSSLPTNKDDISPVDKDELYINQLFVKYQFTSSWDIAAGRHNMRLGSGRLVDIREGPNVRRSFDFTELNYQNRNFKVKGFFSVPVQPFSGVFDNDYLKFDETFSGIYTTTQLSGTTGVDVYIFYQKDDNALYNSGTENERRTSVGIRHFGNYKKLTYNNEAVYQFGTFGDQHISAWTLSLHIERQTTIMGRDFGLGIKTEAISGDRDATDNKMNTFDALYPRGAYFGRVARFGPSNLIDVHPYINTTFNKWQAEIDYDVFWRYSTEDGVYGAPMTLDYPSTNNKRFIAHQMGANISFEPSSFINIQLESNIVFPGAFLKESSLPDTLYHFVLTTEFRF